MSVQEIETLLTVPDHLRKTVVTVYTFGAVTAEDVAKHTGQARAVESNYLNQLARMGYFERQRKGRKVYFYKDGFSLTQQGLMASLLDRVEKLSFDLQSIFWEDISVAMDHRITVLEHAQP